MARGQDRYLWQQEEGRYVDTNAGEKVDGKGVDEVMGIFGSSFLIASIS